MIAEMPALIFLIYLLAPIPFEKLPFYTIGGFLQFLPSYNKE
jgi:hypothetical protein